MQPIQLDNLVQSDLWEKFQNKAGHKTLRINGVLVMLFSAPFFGNYFFIPKGPEIVTKEFLKETKKIARKHKAFFIRVEPQEIKEGVKLTKSLDIHPKTTLVLSLSQSEEVLFESLKPKTRYNIRLAQKKGVVIEKTQNPENIKIFFDLTLQTAERDKIRSHPKSYYKTMMETLGRDGTVTLYLARYQNKYIAATLVSFYKSTATYLHGASSNEHRNVMAPYLLQWQAIVDAKNKKCIWYDFFGIADTDDDNHPWAGITRFKKGFGGEVITSPGTYDYPVSNIRYLLYTKFRLAIKWMRKRMR
ncbi:MAG: peptidoglycan bridge formation glycyltransferase FemA/FemB family protein [Patescibacteria group bacterium]